MRVISVTPLRDFWDRHARDDHQTDQVRRRLKAALAEINRLFNATKGTEDFDRLDVLATLVEAYEARHCPIAPPSPLAATEYEMEKRGLSRRDLEAILGSSGRVSEVLNRQRPPTMTMIRRLHSSFGLSADVLIARYPLETSSASRAEKARARSRSAASGAVML